MEADESLVKINANKCSEWNECEEFDYKNIVLYYLFCELMA